MQQKKFMDIQRICLDDELRAANTDGFHIGDQIEITEKVDGANASFRYDPATGKLAAFSRANELSEGNTLRGFLDYVQSLNPEDYRWYDNYVIFGEWLVSHLVPYRKECLSKFYVYDIYDTGRQVFLTHDLVRNFCKEMGLNYVHALYTGEFTDWDSCIAYAKERSAYTVDGISMEGIVIKNETAIRRDGKYNQHIPFVLKHVNESFAETKRSRHVQKVLDPEVEAEMARAQEIVDSIVTENHVRKEIYKMIDEGVLPEKLTPQDMKTIAQNLPKRVHADCVKEEPELVETAGKYFGKLCNRAVMTYAKKIVTGN